MKITTLVNRNGTWSGPFPGEMDGSSTLVLVSSSLPAESAAGPIAQLAAALPSSVIVGCSTAGDILQGGVLDDVLVATVVTFETTRLRLALAPVPDSACSASAGESIGRELSGPELRVIYVLSEGLGVNGSELTRALTGALPAGVVVTGGLAADGDRFQRTWVVVDGQPRASFVTAVGLYGERLDVGYGSRGGWDPFGPERVVTRAEGNVVYELDGRPALALYQDYLGELASGLPATALLFPLAVRGIGDESSQYAVVRTILGVDEATSSLRFAGDVPQGAVVQLMHANFERLIDAAETASARARIGTPNALCVAVSCVGRRLVLGERVEEETLAVQEALAPGTTLAGFYSYGEISPRADGVSDLHNQTITITMLGERE